MRQPEPNRDSEAFLSALADELLRLPDEATTIRHVGAAASAASVARMARRSHALRLGAAALTVITVLGTGGVTAAGALPAPLQSAVADLGRAMPVPIRVSYPAVSSQVVGTSGPEVDLSRVRRAEEVIRPHQAVLTVTKPEPVEPVTPSIDEQPLPPPFDDEDDGWSGSWPRGEWENGDDDRGEGSRGD